MILLIDPPALGAWNMAVDEALLEAADQGAATLRFYRWSEPTLSLGYFQDYADRWRHEPSSRCSVVRRTSGGGAILHDIELTYSLSLPNRHPLAANRLGLYEAVHKALIETLANWGIGARFCTPSEGASRDCQPFLCFERRAAGDVLVGEAKIAGSAQRRSRGAVLQHGSVLLARSAAAPELPGLNDLGSRHIHPDELISAWLDRLGRQLGAETGPAGELSGGDCDRAAELVQAKYAAADWTKYRGRRKDVLTTDGETGNMRE